MNRFLIFPRYKKVEYYSTWNSRPLSNDRKINNVLIANRGEIACRVSSCAKRLGIFSTAVYSHVDRNSLFVKKADAAVYLNAENPQAGYLDIDRIINCAIKNKSDAIHPGYGFLSQSPEFAEQCLKRNLIWIGPSPQAMINMGIKSHAKDIMKKAGVPVLPGYHGPTQSLEKLYKEALSIGFPVMIKPVRGGGGKGMRVVQKEEDFSTMVESSRRESLNSFNDDELLIEKYILNPRHVEVQVFGDYYGNVVHMFERDCSIQRRHQKIIEEAPAPNISPETRRKLGEAAVLAAKAVDYANAGTVEFILNEDESFYFMEMNTRLQVEHPISEMITGIDFIELQFKIANGEVIPFQQKDIRIHGHAFEARLCAEDPESDFLPSSGKIKTLEWPSSSLCRIDSGYTEGDLLSSYYDSLLAKIIAWGKNREDSLNKLRHSLSHVKIHDIPTNLSFLRTLVDNKHFQNIKINTGFIETHKSELLNLNTNVDASIVCAGALLLMNSSLKNKDELYDFRLNNDKMLNLKCSCNKKEMLLRIQITNDLLSKYQIKVDEATYNCNYTIHDDQISLLLENVITNIPFIKDNESVNLFFKNKKYSFKFSLPEYFKQSHITQSSNELISPLTGTIVKIDVSNNQKVKKGDIICVIEAMKMEHVIRAPFDGTVEKITFQSKATINKDQLLCSIEPAEEL